MERICKKEGFKLGVKEWGLMDDESSESGLTLCTCSLRPVCCQTELK